MLGEPVRFDDASRCSTSDQPLPAGGVLRAIRDASESFGLDAPSELYNEALRYATEGHLRMARERLHMLLALTPDDGDALLLLAKVQVAGQKWQEALATLDEARNVGVHVPLELRRAVEDHLRAEVATDDEQRAAVRAREEGEIKALRQEARRLRSENAQLVARTSELEKETRKWAWTTAGVSSLAILFTLASLVFGGGESTDVPVDPVAEPTPDAVVASEVEATPAPPSTPAELAAQASRALASAPGLEGTALELELRAGSARVTGSVLTHQQRKSAEAVLSGIPGVTAVDASAVKILARTRGTTHVVVRGDNLSKIAYQYYGESSKADRLLAANKSTLGGKPNLQIGQELTIPPID